MFPQILDSESVCYPERFIALFENQIFVSVFFSYFQSGTIYLEMFTNNKLQAFL